jgi:hypothetical protein
VGIFSKKLSKNDAKAISEVTKHTSGRIKANGPPDKPVGRFV